MKILKIVTGTKKIDDTDERIMFQRLKEILEEHRDVLINRLVSDLPTYVDYKFNVKATTKQIEDIKHSLAYVKSKSIDLEKYTPILQGIMSNNFSHIGLTPFYADIDDTIRYCLNNSQLTIVVIGKQQCTVFGN